MCSRNGVSDNDSREASLLLGDLELLLGDLEFRSLKVSHA
jgi:hypothetical protein